MSILVRWLVVVILDIHLQGARLPYRLLSGLTRGSRCSMDSCSAFDVALAVLMQRTPYSLPNSGGIEILKEVRTLQKQSIGVPCC